MLATAGHEEWRVHARDFSRDGVLSPELLVTLLLFMVSDGNRRGYGMLLEQFWDQCRAHGVALPSQDPVSAAALCQARSKISVDLLRHVLQSSAMRFASSFDDLWRWKGRRAFAIDGSNFHLNRGHDVDRYFRRPERAHHPQATVSSLVNVSSGLPVDVVVGPYDASERRMLFEHLDLLEEGDVVILDRGYPCHDIIRELVRRGIDFLVRVPSSHSFRATNVFKRSSLDDAPVFIQPAQPPGSEQVTLELRALRMRDPEGNESIYLTSLPAKRYSHAELADLYRLRWEAEEFYRHTKSDYFGQSQYRARSAHGIKQEILAQAIYLVLARFLIAMASRHCDVEYRELSVKNTVLALADYLARLCLQSRADARRSMPPLLRRIARKRTRRRPGRKCFIM